MAKVVNLVTGVAATAGDKTAVEVGNTTPFLPGRDVVAHIDLDGATGTDAVIAIDGSDDNVTFTADVATYTGLGHSSVSVKCYKYMRASVTTAAGTTAGLLSVWLEGV